MIVCFLSFFLFRLHLHRPASLHPLMVPTGDVMLITKQSRCTRQMISLFNIIYFFNVQGVCLKSTVPLLSTKQKMNHRCPSSLGRRSSS